MPQWDSKGLIDDAMSGLPERSLRSVQVPFRRRRRLWCRSTSHAPGAGRPLEFDGPGPGRRHEV